jgi:hypothetical protein
MVCLGGGGCWGWGTEVGGGLKVSCEVSVDGDGVWEEGERGGTWCLHMLHPVSSIHHHNQRITYLAKTCCLESQSVEGGEVVIDTLISNRTRCQEYAEVADNTVM